MLGSLGVEKGRWGEGVAWTLQSGQVLPLINCVTLGKLFVPQGPQFTHL